MLAFCSVLGVGIDCVSLQAHNCVSATARAGAELGYNLYVVRDAVGDRHLPGVDAALLVKVRIHQHEPGTSVHG